MQVGTFDGNMDDTKVRDKPDQSAAPSAWCPRSWRRHSSIRPEMLLERQDDAVKGQMLHQILIFGWLRSKGMTIASSKQTVKSCQLTKTEICAN